MADSVQSTRNEKGELSPLAEPAKKLFQMDGTSACVVAGFGSATFSTTVPFNISAQGILDNFRDGLQGKDLSFSQKLQSLYVLFGSYLRDVRNLDDVMRYRANPVDLIFTLIMAGYDIDGKPKIGTLAIVNQTHERRNEFPIGQELQWFLGGQFDVARDILQNPTQALYANDDVISRYARARAVDRGASLSLDDLRSLAEVLMKNTEKKYPHVGGPRQMAIFTNGKMTSFQQPRFKAVPSPLPPFTIFDVVDIEEGGVRSENATGLFRTSMFKRTQLRLDGNLFFKSLIKDSTVEYNGGITHLDSSNSISNSTLVILPGAKRNPDAVKRLSEGFKWASIVHRSQSPEMRQ